MLEQAQMCRPVPQEFGVPLHAQHARRTLDLEGLDVTVLVPRDGDGSLPELTHDLVMQ